MHNILKDVIKSLRKLTLKSPIKFLKKVTIVCSRRIACVKVKEKKSNMNAIYEINLSFIHVYIKETNFSR